MSDKENEKFDDKLSLTEKPVKSFRKIRWPIQAGCSRRRFHPAWIAVIS